jgi:hypothetical protein
LLIKGMKNMVVEKERGGALISENVSKGNQPNS